MNHHIDSGHNAANLPTDFGAPARQAGGRPAAHGEAPSPENVASFKNVLHDGKTEAKADRTPNFEHKDKTAYKPDLDAALPRGESTAQKSTAQESTELLKKNLQEGKADFKPDNPEETQGQRDHIAGMFSADSILRSMQGNNSVHESGAVAASPHIQPENLAAELADRILVSKSDTNADTAEVRISLKDSVLPDTEIILRREGEQLKVILLTANASSHQTLLDATPALRELLAKQNNASSEQVSVEVSLRGDNQQDGRQNQRSRGLDYLADGADK
jgi:type III secretion system needle length determinant